MSPDLVKNTSPLVAGVWSTTSQAFDVHNPFTGELLTQVHSASGLDARDALSAAHAISPSWGHTAPEQRSALLSTLHQLTLENSERLARIITLENGKPLTEARAEVEYAAGYLSWFAHEALRIPGDARRAPGGHRQLVFHEPVGPSLLITPWNFPLAMATRKVAPAFAAGNVVLIKPSSATPLTILAWAELVIAALDSLDLPRSIVSILPSDNAAALSTALLSDARLRKLSFTGSTSVGAKLLAQAAPIVARTSMELGGNAPFIVHDDADLDAAVTGAMAAKMRASGQTCVAANRFYVHHEVAHEFMRKLAIALDSLTAGDPLIEGTTLGPLINANEAQRIESLVSQALHTGDAHLFYERSLNPNLPASFSPPRILSRVKHHASIVTDEIFGPVIPVMTYTDINECITQANDTPYGLVAYAYTNSQSIAWRLVDGLEAGMVAINRGVISDPTAPFGGIKSSGLGREGGHEGIMDYLTTKYVAWQ